MKARQMQRSQREKYMLKEKATWGFIHTAIPRTHLGNMIKAAMLDIVIVAAAYLLALSVRTTDSPLDYGRGIQMIGLAAVFMPIILYGFGVYHRIWERTSGHGITVIINAVGTATFGLLVADILVQPRPLPLSVIVMGNLMALSGFVGVRYRSRLISGMSWRWKAVWAQEFPKSATRVLIVGAGEAGQTLALQLKHRFPDNDYKIVGFIDDDPRKQGLYVEGCRVLGGRADINEISEKYSIDLIVVAIHNINGPDFREILNHCEKTKARIKVVPDVFALVNARHSATLLRDVEPEDLIGRSVVSRHEAIDLSPVMRKVVLVTGAAGSIGSELARQLCSYEPVNLLLLDANESGLHDLVVDLQSKNPNVKLTPILADIAVMETLEPVFRRYRPQVVFHAAAYKHVHMMEIYPEQAIRVNIGGTRNLAELARDYEVERFVLISTDKAVNPTSVMGASKRICEMMVQAISKESDSSTLFTAVRFGNVLGSRGSAVPTFNRQISNGGPVTITHPEMTRYFMSIPEASNLVIHAACMTRGNDTFLLKMGEVVRIMDLAERMIRLRGMRPGKDIEIKYIGIKPGEKLHEQLYDGSAESATETRHPSIIQITPNASRHTSGELLNWVDDLLHNGLPAGQRAIDILRWGLTESEQYAVSVIGD